MSDQVRVYGSEDMKYENLCRNKLTFVDFWAAWCGPCRMMSPVIDALASETEGVVFAKLNVDDCPDVAMGLGIASIPTMILFKDGEAVERVIGVTPKEELKKLIDKHR